MTSFRPTDANGRNGRKGTVKSEGGSRQEPAVYDPGERYLSLTFIG